MIYAAGGQSFEATLTGAATGLVGTLGARIIDGQGADVLARTTTGIVEHPAGSGIYTATLTAPDAPGSYVVVWDWSGIFTGEDLTVTASAPFPSPSSTTWRPDYASSAELKHYIAPGIADNVDDAELALAIAAASRAIDHACGRQFGQLATAAARYYSPTSAGRAAVVIDDLMSIAGLAVKVDERGDGVFGEALGLDTEFRLFPWNAPAEGRPWTMLVAEVGTRWPIRHRALEVTAKWGWAAVPAEVKQACLIQASRLFVRKNAPFGVAGSPEMGSELRLLSKLDPDVAVLLSGVRRYWAAV